MLHLTVDDTFAPTVELFRLTLRAELGCSPEAQCADHIVAKSFSDALEVAEIIAEEAELQIGSLESLGPVHISIEARSDIVAEDVTME
ncbi:MAG: hypothetical protein HY868_18400 [Chloroflexi bacterium]|nr:hypothetical protein [Chloroflexota bacterium]